MHHMLPETVSPIRYNNQSFRTEENCIAIGSGEVLDYQNSTNTMTLLIFQTRTATYFQEMERTHHFLKTTYLMGRRINLKTSWEIRSKNTTFKAFHMTTYICLTFKKVITIELFWLRLVFVRADNISLVSLA